jgi:hypothetical protein
LCVFSLLRGNGVLGLIGTNTLAQGDTREGSLAIILGDGGAISRARKRLRWPGEAAVVVSVVHIVKGRAPFSYLGDRPVERISAYLVEGNFDQSPASLAANSRKAFQGSIVLGMGFTFDDEAAAKGTAASLSEMHEITASHPETLRRIYPYLGGNELNTSPTQHCHRFVINVNDMHLEDIKRELPEIYTVLDHYVRPERQKEKNKKNGSMYYEWWRYWRERPELYRAISDLRRAFALSRVAVQMAIASVSTEIVFADSCVIFAFENFAPFAVLQSRVHELWARFFSSSMKDDLRYTPAKSFRTFPFPANFQTDVTLERLGQAYHEFRGSLTERRNEGLTKIYNRFHAQSQNQADIVRLRSLHVEMDAAVLRAYGWDHLADRAAPEFIEQDADDRKARKTRLDWPADIKDEVLASLLSLNAANAAAEHEAGLTAAPEDEDEEDDDDEE